jgi:hypothetical protein
MLKTSTCLLIPDILGQRRAATPSYVQQCSQGCTWDRLCQITWVHFPALGYMHQAESQSIYTMHHALIDLHKKQSKFEVLRVNDEGALNTSESANCSKLSICRFRVGNSEAGINCCLNPAPVTPALPRDCMLMHALEEVKACA